MKYKLNEINIDAACQEADAFLKKRKTESKGRIHTRLSIEEVLLNYMSAFGRDAEFTMDYGGGISKNKIRLTVSGNPVDPFNLAEDASDEEQGLANILLRIGQRPKWKYARGVNTIIYTLDKKAFRTGENCWLRSLPLSFWDWLSGCCLKTFQWCCDRISSRRSFRLSSGS